MGFIATCNPPAWTRRQVLLALGALTACGPAWRPKGAQLPAQIAAGPPPAGHTDNIEALLDTLLPSEPDSPGAREAGASALLQSERFLRLAIDQGFVAPLGASLVDTLDDAAAEWRLTLDRALDIQAAKWRGTTPFADLTRELREEVVEALLADEQLRDAVVALRAAAFIAFLGATQNDLGLQYVGLPAFEDFAAGICVRGYPREVDGETDDYTFNQAPAATVGDVSILTASGDLP